MLQYFFEDGVDYSGQKKDNAFLFEGLKILEAGEQYLSYMGQYPVINLSLKSGKQSNYKLAFECIVDEIAQEYDRHEYILKGDILPEPIKEKYRRIMELSASEKEYYKALQFLSQCLEKYYGKKTIILIDEYDVPLENAYMCGFYPEMVSFMCSFLNLSLRQTAAWSLL